MRNVLTIAAFLFGLPSLASAQVQLGGENFKFYGTNFGIEVVQLDGIGTVYRAYMRGPDEEWTISARQYGVLDWGAYTMYVLGDAIVEGPNPFLLDANYWPDGIDVIYGDYPDEVRRPAYHWLDPRNAEVAYYDCHVPDNTPANGYIVTCPEQGLDGWIVFERTTGTEFTIDDLQSGLFDPRVDEPAYSNYVAPEPVTMLLLGSGLAGVGAVGRRRRRQDGLAHQDASTDEPAT